MKLLKLISFLFLIYFIRRFIQAYKVMQQIHAANLNQPRSTPKPDNAINADYKVID